MTEHFLLANGMFSGIAVKFHGAPGSKQVRWLIFSPPLFVFSVSTSLVAGQA